MQRTLLLALLSGAAIITAGCAASNRADQVPPPQSLPMPVGGPSMPSPELEACNANAARVVLGQIANVEATEAAKAASGAEDVRVLYPNQPITQEFVAARLNLETDGANRIVRVRCG
ncbi:I78 family peptidase inhibitor [Aurantimonas marina]|uniref:I78 family peptidase inhibitor n=1 Tax=Aurantimonas marina TaxID=2780508 RepID=UPI0019D24804|nr:I78 family peptidase inhibitor [Aurantimonas marina]